MRVCASGSPPASGAKKKKKKEYYITAPVLAARRLAPNFSIQEIPENLAKFRQLKSKAFGEMDTTCTNSAVPLSSNFDNPESLVNFEKVDFISLPGNLRTFWGVLFEAVEKNPSW